jgi:heat shock protein HslJ
MLSSSYKKSKSGVGLLILSFILGLCSLAACGDLNTPSAGAVISVPPIPVTTNVQVPVQISPTTPPKLTQKPTVTPTTTSTPSQLIGRNWKLESYINGTALENSRLNITTTFSDTGRVAGKDDCNYYYGDYSLGDSGKLRIGEVSETAVACGDPLNQNVSRNYLISRLSTAAFYEISGNTLTLKDSKSNTLLIFRQS